jgi:hypothetical protein
MCLSGLIASSLLLLLVFHDAFESQVAAAPSSPLEKLCEPMTW